MARSGVVSWPSTGRVATYGRPCRLRATPCGALPILSWRFLHRVATQGRVAGPFWSRYKKLYRDPTPAVHIARCVARCCAVSRHQRHPLSATIQFLFRDPAPSQAHCTSCRAHALGYIAGPPRPYRGRGWPCRGPSPCAQASLPSLCVTIQLL